MSKQRLFHLARGSLPVRRQGGCHLVRAERACYNTIQEAAAQRELHERVWCNFRSSGDVVFFSLSLFIPAIFNSAKVNHFLSCKASRQKGIIMVVVVVAALISVLSCSGIKHVRVVDLRVSAFYTD